MGGGPIPPEIIRRFVDLAGGPAKARIVVFPMASGDSDAGIEMTADLNKLGAKAERIVFDHAQADTEEAAKRLDGVTGIWFGGGDQVKLTAALAGTKVEAAMHRLLAGGAVLGGTSAGAAVMTTPMLTGEERHVGGVRPPADPKSPLAAYMTVARDDVETVQGFGFLSGAIVDQHFIRRRRSNRLLSVVLEHPQLVAVGIDESTAVEVGPGREVEGARRERRDGLRRAARPRHARRRSGAGHHGRLAARAARGEHVRPRDRRGDARRRARPVARDVRRRLSGAS